MKTALVIPMLYLTFTAVASFVVQAPSSHNAMTRNFQSSSRTSRLTNVNDDDLQFETPKLGIDIGHQLAPMSQADIDELKKDCAKIIDDAVQDGLVDMNRLHDRWERNIHDGALILEQAMTLNGIQESKRFNKRIDMIVGKFLSNTFESRERVHFLAHEDEERAKKEEIEKERRKSKPKTEPWGKTNKAWDEWDDSDWW